MSIRVSKIIQCLGPIFIAALFLLLNFYAVQALIDYYVLGINLLSEKNLGKIIFSLMVMLTIDLFLRFQNKKYLSHFYQTVFGIFRWRSITIFGFYFFLFFLFHLATITLFVGMGHAQFIACLDGLTSSFFLKAVWGFVATFFLVWSEEAIFRVALFNHFHRFLKTIPAMIITSLCFMAAHGLVNPYHFFVHEWRIAIGLFLFGLMLNSIYVKTGNVMANMGAHAGVVFVKVLQRRLFFVQFLPHIQSFWLIDADLRQSVLACIFFFLITLYSVFSSKMIKK
jgi:membrane protease YdiL (CAAX protease family)